MLDWMSLISRYLLQRHLPKDKSAGRSGLLLLWIRPPIYRDKPARPGSSLLISSIFKESSFDFSNKDSSMPLAVNRGFNIECGCGLKEGQMVGVGKILENFALFGIAYILTLRNENFFELFPKTNLSDK